MKISLNTIRRYTTVDLSVDELVSLINQRLGGVEDTHDISSRYEGAVIVKVVSCRKHENADKLNVCMVDDGSGALTQVVCGAPNVRADMFAVWLKPGSIVPSTATDAEPFVLGSRELRGEMSHGMLASPKELALGDSHEGILEIDPRDASDVEVAPGVRFASAYGLTDTIIEIENKMFTHRPDLFGQIGVAREIAGIQHLPFTSPDWYGASDAHTHEHAGEQLPLTVFNQATDKVPRFMAVSVRDVTVKPSPVWLQTELMRLGGKPINNVVDATNYVMLLTAQPTHAYDYHKLRGRTVGARMAGDGETVRLLNGKQYELTADDIVITDGEGPVGLAGIMGGGDSEVSAETKDIVLEVANFDMYAVRKSSMRHGVFTDALTRFNKGQSPLQNDIVLDFLTQLILDIAGGSVASEVFDAYDSLPAERSLSVTPAFVNERLGLNLTADEIAHLLKNVEFKVDYEPNDILKLTAPFWRTDIELPEDLVEEVGRLYGFDRLPRELPVRSIRPAAANPALAVESAVRRVLSKAGANEVLTYSFVHEKFLTRASQNPAHAFRLSNALSPDLQFYRTSLTPSLLDKVHMNIKAGHDMFALYELGKVHFKVEADPSEPALPNEDKHLGFVISKLHPTTGAAFFDARRYLEEVVDISISPLTPMKAFDMASDEWGRELTAAYDPERSALIVINDQIWGVVGEFRVEVRRAFKLPEHTAGFEIHRDIIKTAAPAYRPLSRFPSVTQDVSIRTIGTPFASIDAAVQKVVGSQPKHLTIIADPTVIYRPESGNEETTTYRLKVTSFDSTLTGSDVRPIVEAIDAAAQESFDGRVI